MATPGIETLAREQRRRLFAQAMEAIHADALLTAHHLDDQAETVLMRLLRGAGGRGLCGIHPSASFGGGKVLRPFLGVTKQALTGLLTQVGVHFRHDESNDLCLTPRNTLRLELLPKLEALYPGAARHIAQTAEVLREDDSCLSGLAAALYQQALYAQPPIFALADKPLLTSPAALRLRALRLFYQAGLSLAGLTPHERELSYADSLALNALLDAPPGSSLNLPCGLSALRGNACLHLLRQGGQPLAPAPVTAPLFLSVQSGDYTLAGVTLRLAPAPLLLVPPQDATSVQLPEELLPQCMLRLPLPGDRIRPLGAPGEKPLRRYLTDRKLDIPFRGALPVLALRDQILWIPALVTAEALRWKPGARQWRLTLYGGTPYLPNDDKE